MLRSADVFCRVIDNLGDAGVCWRLVRQLARAHGLQVRLIIDQPQVLQRFVAPDLDDQALLAARRVQVLAWVPGLEPEGTADLVIEAFGCEVPRTYAVALAGRTPAARWYNLEYLSAEDWVVGCHGLPSPHATLPLSRTFFFPGFVEGTGGLLREAGLLAEVAAVQAGVPLPGVAPGVQPDVQPDVLPAERVVNLFCYAHAGVSALLDAFEQASAVGGRPLRCRVFQGPAQALAQQWSGDHGGHRLQLEFLPWLGQAAFDRMLWTADFNVVRGEDSFVRAQWAARPFLWDIYPTDDGAHLVKLEAFLRCYGSAAAGQAVEVVEVVEALDALGVLSRAFVQRDLALLTAQVASVLQALPVLQGHAQAWQVRQGARVDLASALIAHAESG